MTRQEAYIDFIINELRKGNVSFTKVFKLNLTKFNLTRPTFSKYWKIANQRHTEQRTEIERQKLNKTTQEEIKAVTKQILTKYEALEILTGIAKGDTRKIKIKNKTYETIPNDNARLKAIEIGAKIEGWNAPKQIEDVTNKPLTIQELKEQLKDLGIEEE